jgi:hypothetical protein
MHAQQVLVQKNDGVTSVTLQSGENLVATFPSSSPETIVAGGSNATQTPASDVRDITWILKFSVVGKVFKDVSFADPEVGYIVTELGSVYKSVDGGDSWNSVMLFPVSIIRAPLTKALCGGLMMAELPGVLIYAYPSR